MKKLLICLLLAGLLICSVSCEFGKKSDNDTEKGTTGTEQTVEPGDNTTDPSKQESETEDVSGSQESDSDFDVGELDSEEGVDPSVWTKNY